MALRNAPRSEVRWLTLPEVALLKFDDDRMATTEVSQMDRSKRCDQKGQCRFYFHHLFLLIKQLTLPPLTSARAVIYVLAALA